MGRAVFFDRDGTLNEEVGHVVRADALFLLPVAAPALKRLIDQGFKIIVITNQSGIARGLLTEDDLRSIHSSMQNQLEALGVHLDAIYHCPHHPDIGIEPYRLVCDCRKPSPGLIERAARDHELTLAECYVVGDRYHDIQMAHAVGARGILVLTGHGKSEVEREGSPQRVEPDFVAKDVLAAAEWIIQRSK